MEDLFEREQKISLHALSYLEELESGAPFDINEYRDLTKEYVRILRQLRRIVRISDKTTEDLNTSKLDLMDKVHYDELTGIYNRRFLDENLRRTIKSLSCSGGKLSLLMVDIDFFKRYNDTYGHSMGDTCLRQIAQTLQSCVRRPNDFVARYGGEEFVIVLPNTDEKGARLTASRALSMIRACNIAHQKNEVASYVTASIGALTDCTVLFRPVEAYIEKVDKALYLSKKNGKNQYTFVQFEEEI